VKLVIYGASDDLIEVEGDFTDEIGAYGCGETEPAYLAISDGTLLSVEYGDGGVWRFTLVRQGRANMVKEEAPQDDENNYSDRITLTDPQPFEWVLFGGGLAKS
jgi:hypothetical protein